MKKVLISLSASLLNIAAMAQQKDFEGSIVYRVETKKR